MFFITNSKGCSLPDVGLAFSLTKEQKKCFSRAIFLPLISQKVLCYIPRCGGVSTTDANTGVAMERVTYLRSDV